MNDDNLFIRFTHPYTKHFSKMFTSGSQDVAMGRDTFFFYYEYYVREEALVEDF